jgi:hypothetical protein
MNTKLSAYLLNGYHNLLLNNELCPVIHMNVAFDWAMAKGASLDEAYLYGLMELERLLSQQIESILNLQEQIGKVKFTINGATLEANTLPLPK